MEGTQPLPHMSEPPTVRAAIISPLGHADHGADHRPAAHQGHDSGTTPPPSSSCGGHTDWVPVCTTSAPPPPDVTDHRTMQPAGVRLLAVRPTAPRPETERLPHGVHTGNRRLLRRRPSSTASPTQASSPHTHALARALPAIWTIRARARRGPPCTTDPSYRATVYTRTRRNGLRGKPPNSC